MLSDWVRSKPKPTADDMPCCDTKPQYCSDRCEVVPYCEGCGVCAYLPCECEAIRPQRQVWKCWRCPNLGRNKLEEVGAALEALGHAARLSSEDDRQQQLRLCRLERRLEVTHLLRMYDCSSDWLDDEHDECDRAREDKLRKLQSNFALLTWLDGSPILNRSWTVHYWLFYYDPRAFALSAAAVRESRRPRLHIVVRADDSLSETTNVIRRRNEDLHTLNTQMSLEVSTSKFQKRPPARA